MFTFIDWRNGTPFINSLCRTLNDEYKEVNEKEEKIILKKSLEKRDLTQLFTTFVTTLVSRTNQTPEFRSSLSKTIRFRLIKKNHENEEFKPDYDGAEKEAFKDARKYYVSLGYKAKRIISDGDCNALWHTITKEYSPNVHKAIAWVILNRYNSNREYWGGNQSLETICKHPGRDEFMFWKNPAPNPKYLDKNDLNSFHDLLMSIYAGDDPSKGATNFFIYEGAARNMKGFEFTVTIDGTATIDGTVINYGCYHFYKRLLKSANAPRSVEQSLEQPSVSSQPREQPNVRSRESAEKRKLEFD